MAASLTPWMQTVTLTVVNHAYQLSDLISQSGPDAPLVPASGVYRAQYLALHSDDENAGARIFVGNSKVSSVNKGVTLFATQVWPIYSMEGNLIRLDQIFVSTDIAGAKLNVTFITR